MTFVLDEMGILLVMAAGIIIWEVIEHGVLFGD